MSAHITAFSTIGTFLEIPEVISVAESAIEIIALGAISMIILRVKNCY